MPIPGQPLSDELLARVCDVVDQFDAAWQAVADGATPPRIEEALQDISEADQPAFLRELLGVELECRFRFGEQPSATEYLARFPRHRELIDALVCEVQAGTTLMESPFPQPPATVTLKPGAVLGNYTIVEPIGQGGMGQVFKATHRTMKRTVALKVISPKSGWSSETQERFRREVETVSRLSHPNIVTAHDADEVDGIHFLAMELVDGIDLSRLVRERGPLSLEVAVNYVLQAARGLEHAHSEGIVHRDIKPANLIVNAKGVVKVLDLGLARWQPASDSAEPADGTLT